MKAFWWLLLCLPTVVHGQILLLWDHVPTPQATIRIERAINQEPFSILAELPEHSSWYRDDSANAAVTYRYQLRSIVGERVSDPSPVVQVVLHGNFVNVSTRAEVTDERIIAGFVVTKLRTKVLARVVGPGLDRFGVLGTLQDPLLLVVNQQGGQTIASNDNWMESPDDGTAAKEAAQKVGAFTLAPNSKDASIVVMLDPGIYSIHAVGVNGAQGVVLAEVYLVEN
jgi:hypothetical protein